MDIEAALCEWLSDLGSTFTVTPLGLSDMLPALRIASIGGPVDPEAAHPTVDVQAYTLKDSTAPRSALDLANTVVDRMLGFPFMASSVLVDFAHCSTGPTFIGYPDQTLSVVRTVFTLDIRR